MCIPFSTDFIWLRIQSCGFHVAQVAFIEKHSSVVHVGCLHTRTLQHTDIQHLLQQHTSLDIQLSLISLRYIQGYSIHRNSTVVVVVVVVVVLVLVLLSIGNSISIDISSHLLLDHKHHHLIQLNL